jgi:hypothetical protein
MMEIIFEKGVTLPEVYLSTAHVIKSDKGKPAASPNACP